MSLKRGLGLLKASGAAEELRDLGLRSQHVLLLKELLSSPVKQILLLQKTRHSRRRARRGGGDVDAVGLRDSGQAASGGPGRGSAGAGLWHRSTRCADHRSSRCAASRRRVLETRSRNA
jgi:hypothetical protein